MQYLIMRCDYLADQYECDADRTPITITDNYEQWLEKNDPDYDYEIYKFINDGFEKIELESGMALYYWKEGAFIESEKPNVIEKFKDYSRDDTIPESVKECMERTIFDDSDYVDSLFNCGYITWYDKDMNYYVYGEYYGNHYDYGF